MSRRQVVTQFIVEIYTDGDYNECLTTFFTTIRIINSRKSVWPIFQLYCVMDNQVVIEKNIYGSSDIEVKIWYSGENGEKIGDPVTYSLLYLESNVELPAKLGENGPLEEMEESQRRHVSFTCLSKPAFLTMTQFVNKLWEEPTELRPIDFVYELLDSRGIDYRIFEDGCNEELVQQLIVPPMTIRNSIDYINEKFGIFTGPMFRYVNYSGQFLMWDLKAYYDKTKDSPWTTHHKLPAHSEIPGLFKEVNDTVIERDDHFVTYDQVQALHYANANVVQYGFDNVFITHPHNDIAAYIKGNTKEIIEKFGIYHINPNMKYHKELEHRKLYYYDQKGFETGDGYTGKYSDAFMSSTLSGIFQDSASLRFRIYRNVKIHLLQKIGEVLYMKPYSDHEKFPGSNYEGGYIVSDTEIVLTREQGGVQQDNMNCIATVTGYRTAQSMD